MEVQGVVAWAPGAPRGHLANLPLPESVIAAIGAGLALEQLRARERPRALPATRWMGSLLFGGGALLVLWAIAQARQMRIAEPSRLLTRGPYALSRNPMYVGWLAVALGLALSRRSPWLVATTLLAFLYLDRAEIPREEAVLARRFGTHYARYRERVPRYGLRRLGLSLPLLSAHAS